MRRIRPSDPKSPATGMTSASTRFTRLLSLGQYPSPFGEGDLAPQKSYGQLTASSVAGGVTATHTWSDEVKGA